MAGWGDGGVRIVHAAAEGRGCVCGGGGGGGWGRSWGS